MSVPTFHLKQLAQALASHTPGVGQIENCVQVTGLKVPYLRETAAG
jgi:hypothetical protein